MKLFLAIVASIFVIGILSFFAGVLMATFDMRQGLTEGFFKVSMTLLISSGTVVIVLFGILIVMEIIK